MTRPEITASIVTVQLEFGGTGPTAAEIAAFLGRAMRGKSSLNRLGRDTELAAWLRQHRAGGKLEDILAACIDRFGVDRAPSRTALAAFLHAAGRRGRHGDGRRLDRDPEVAEWLLSEAPKRTLAQLIAACSHRWGAKRTPSRSAAARFLQSAGCRGRGKRLRLDGDAEVAAWLRLHAPADHGRVVGGVPRRVRRRAHTGQVGDPSLPVPRSGSEVDPPKGAPRSGPRVSFCPNECTFAFSAALSAVRPPNFGLRT